GVGVEGPGQCCGAGARQIGRRVHQPVAGAGDTEHRRELAARRGTYGDSARRGAGLPDGAAVGGAEAAEQMPARVGLTRAEVPGRTVLGGGAGLERREIDADHADVRAVTAVAAPRRAGAVTANLAGVAAGGAVPLCPAPHP